MDAEGIETWDGLVTVLFRSLPWSCNAKIHLRGMNSDGRDSLCFHSILRWGPAIKLGYLICSFILFVLNTKFIILIKCNLSFIFTAITLWNRFLWTLKRTCEYRRKSKAYADVAALVSPIGIEVQRYGRSMRCCMDERNKRNPTAGIGHPLTSLWITPREGQGRRCCGLHTREAFTICERNAPSFLHNKGSWVAFFLWRTEFV